MKFIVLANICFEYDCNPIYVDDVFCGIVTGVSREAVNAEATKMFEDKKTDFECVSTLGSDFYLQEV